MTNDILINDNRVYNNNILKPRDLKILDGIINLYPEKPITSLIFKNNQKNFQTTSLFLSHYSDFCILCKGKREFIFNQNEKHNYAYL